MTDTTGWRKRQMKLIDLHWSYIKGEGRVKYTKEFDETDNIVKLDMLQDVIADLKDKYNSLLSQPTSEKNT